MADELKPCPFCGEEPFTQTLESYVCVWCGNDDCIFKYGLADGINRDEVVAAWNRRDAPAQGVQIPAEVAETIRVLLHREWFALEIVCLNANTTDLQRADAMAQMAAIKAAETWLAQATGTQE